ncbi:MAG: hypothetical protein KAS86_05255 [Candidatus Omnitrophica bacterium]|nr:hypothetical protein [Candidatus Omnitrophota bacterium]
MKSGDILLFKAENDILSMIIAWGTNSRYSHVAVCVSPGMNLAIEAITKGGVRARDIRAVPRERYDVYRVREGHAYDPDRTISYLVRALNNRYDYLGVIFLGILKLLARIGIPLKDIANKWQKDRDYFCSELCYEAFYSGGGLDIVPDVPDSDVTAPGDIAKSPVMEAVEEVVG